MKLTQTLKRWWLLSLCILVLTANANALVTKPPKAVLDAFAKAYPTAEKARWKKEDGNYEVYFSDNGKEISAEYKADGSLIATETEITEAELPEAVLDVFHKHHPKAKVTEYAKITKADGRIVFEIEVKKKDYLYDSNGMEVRN